MAARCAAACRWSPKPNGTAGPPQSAWFGRSQWPTATPRRRSDACRVDPGGRYGPNTCERAADAHGAGVDRPTIIDGQSDDRASPDRLGEHPGRGPDDARHTVSRAVRERRSGDSNPDLPHARAESGLAGRRVTGTNSARRVARRASDFGRHRSAAVPTPPARARCRRLGPWGASSRCRTCRSPW